VYLSVYFSEKNLKYQGMLIDKTDFEGLIVIHPRVFPDERGYFFESFNQKEFRHLTGLDIQFVQDNEALSVKGVLRGLHYQLPPYAQAKLVRVIEGSVLDVVVDIRPGSPTYGQYFSIELSGDNKLQLFIPVGFAHGYIVLSNSAVFAYKCDQYYHPDYERGIQCEDMMLDIDWKLPIHQRIISAKDRKQAPFRNHAPFNFEPK